MCQLLLAVTCAIVATPVLSVPLGGRSPLRLELEPYGAPQHRLRRQAFPGSGMVGAMCCCVDSKDKDVVCVGVVVVVVCVCVWVVCVCLSERVCVRVRARACARALESVCARVRTRLRACMYVYISSRKALQYLFHLNPTTLQESL